LYNGSKEYKTEIIKEATCTLNGGTIRNSLNNGGRAVVVASYATFTMNGGKVENKGEGTYGTVPAIDGGKIIINGGTIESAGTGVYSTVGTLITGGTIDAGWFAFEGRDITIDPAEGKTVKISAGEKTENEEAKQKAAIFKAMSKLATSKGNQILGGEFNAPRVIATSSLDNTNAKIYGGLFKFDVSEYVPTGYVVNTADKDNTKMYEVKPNTPSITPGELKENGEIEIGIVEELKEELEDIFEKEIDKNETLKEALAAGKSVNIHVQMERLEEDKIKAKEIKALRDAAKNQKIAKIYDITLVMKADGTQIDTISEISSKLKFKVLIPEDLLKDNRTFFMYRYHEGENGGEVEKLTGELDEENYFTFESDKFSTYALAYEDKIEEPTAGGEGTAQQKPVEDRKEETEIKSDKKEEKDETPKTGSVDVVLFVSIMIAFLSVAGIVAVKKYTR